MDWDSVEQRFPWECRTWHNHESVVPWLKANIGEFDLNWYRLGSDIANGVLDTQMPDLYRFGTERDAILFRLKWS
jgi:hypothetical protein